MVRRGDEIWQYYVGSEEYHSPSARERARAGRISASCSIALDGFVSADTPYTGESLTTRPLVFSGNRLC